MRHCLKFTSLLVMALLLCLHCYAQSKSQKSAQKLFAEVEEGEKHFVECARKSREYQIAKFGRVLPTISGHCYGDCPTELIKPYYPRDAKRFGISGMVEVETIVNED